MTKEELAKKINMLQSQLEKLKEEANDKAKEIFENVTTFFDFKSISISEVELSSYYAKDWSSYYDTLYFSINRDDDTPHFSKTLYIYKDELVINDCALKYGFVADENNLEYIKAIASLIEHKQDFISLSNSFELIRFIKKEWLKARSEFKQIKDREEIEEFNKKMEDALSKIKANSLVRKLDRYNTTYKIEKITDKCVFYCIKNNYYNCYNQTCRVNKSEFLSELIHFGYELLDEAKGE